MMKRLVIDRKNPCWMIDEHSTQIRIQTIFNMFNDILTVGSDLTLRDVQREFGIPITRDSFLCGWVGKVGNRIRFNIYIKESEIVIELNIPVEDIREFMED